MECWPTWRCLLAFVAPFFGTILITSAKVSYSTKSNVLPWVDVDTPEQALTHASSRGATWSLVMSDEFNTEGRTFEAGADHLWTAVEKPDGVNAALEVYAINMTSTECDKEDNCYFYIESDIDEQNITVWNDYITPPGYENVSFYYRAAMVQGWNKFCFQGGLVVVRAQLPGVIGGDSGNPDLVSGTKNTRVSSIDYYPTWPGIWMFGNLGRSIFTGSTARIWPFSYNECNETVFDYQNQRISACDANPGSGMNPYQGRGAPEIDILEGGGTEISSSMQIGPGMPEEFRPLHDKVSSFCMYTYDCTTTGANNPDVPTAFYEKLRGHKTWYQGMRYGANNLCAEESDELQTFAKINASLTKGVTENACTTDICPASFDVNADLGFMNNKTEHWGINSNGTCFPRMNAYTGAYLCNAGNTAPQCTESGGSTSAASSFTYQMDALSSNWGIHLAAYIDWVTYSVEWVTGGDGYIRWEVEGHPIYEITAATVTNPPQNAAQTNPKKIMIEEPMYFIFNVALSSSWGSKPPNAGTSGCYGDGKDEKTNAICDAFPMKMKIDYIRVYQDTTTMAYGCDPASHPTKQWIEDHIDLYQDFDNLVVEVSGKASCHSDDDCTIAITGSSPVRTGHCSNGRCECVSRTWTGPRCTETTSVKKDDKQYGPPMALSIGVAAVTVLATAITILYASAKEKRESERRLRSHAFKVDQLKQAGSVSTQDTERNHGFLMASHPEQDVDGLLNEAMVLAFLENCDLAHHELVFSTTPADQVTPLWTNSNHCSQEIENEANMAAEATRQTSQRKSWYKRRNDELVQLRQAVKELSAQLDQLKLDARLRSNLALDQLVLTAEAATESGIWESIAKRNEKERRTSETENLSLRNALLTSVTHAKSLRRAFKRRLRDAVRVSFGYGFAAFTTNSITVNKYSAPVRKKRFGVLQTRVFDELSAGMDTNFAALDDLFKSLGMHELPCPGRRNNTASSMLEGKYAEILDCYSLPFDFKRVDAAIWGLGSDGLEDANATFVERVAAEANTKLKSVGFSFKAGRIDANQRTGDRLGVLSSHRHVTPPLRRNRPGISLCPLFRPGCCRGADRGFRRRRRPASLFSPNATASRASGCFGWPQGGSHATAEHSTVANSRAFDCVGNSRGVGGPRNYHSAHGGNLTEVSRPAAGPEDPQLLHLARLVVCVARVPPARLDTVLDRCLEAAASVGEVLAAAVAPCRLPLTESEEIMYLLRSRMGPPLAGTQSLTPRRNPRTIPYRQHIDGLMAK
ncbi:hypothetical protein ON010_g269 [Phytophthora cinnamomi]|nr:hypothetical protein ON010_g269 [Phytophthora cinnamomi]